jgi:hypothetical protein
MLMIKPPTWTIEQSKAVLSGPAEEKQQLKEMVADRLKELTKGVTSGTPDRAWYSVSSRDC